MMLLVWGATYIVKVVTFLELYASLLIIVGLWFRIRLDLWFLVPKFYVSVASIFLVFLGLSGSEDYDGLFGFLEQCPIMITFSQCILHMLLATREEFTSSVNECILRGWRCVDSLTWLVGQWMLDLWFIWCQQPHGIIWYHLSWCGLNHKIRLILEDCVSIRWDLLPTVGYHGGPIFGCECM